MKNLTAEIAEKERVFNETKSQMDLSLKDFEKKSQEVGKQNEILHRQLVEMGKKVDSIHEAKVDTISKDGAAEDDKNSEEVSSLKSQIKELREVVTYMRSEREICETQLQTARLSVEHQRASGEITKKSLEEARTELGKLQKKLYTDSDIERASKSLLETESRLKQSDEQLLLLRESNKLLREETDKLEKTILSVEKERDDAKNEVKPSHEKCLGLEVEKAALKAEKQSLLREVNIWKDRVKSLVSKFHQVRSKLFQILNIKEKSHIYVHCISD